MLYESKMDGSLAAHATQTNLRLGKDDSAQGITEFSWRDIPYFMYKRSEATAHGTRDYLMAKWQANFPNTGFWTYIKYTIIEQHVYRDELPSMAWKDQAALVFGFFQMVGYNRYRLGGKVVDFVDVLERLDRGWGPSGPKNAVEASRTLYRKPITKTRKSVDHPNEVLPYGPA